MADNLFAQTLAETEDLVDEELGEEKDSKTEELLRRVLEENRTANADLIRQIVGQNRPQPGKPLQEDDPLAGLEFKVDDLPDPQHDPAAFHKAYLERATGALRGAVQKIEERTNRRVQQTLSDKELFSKAEELVKTADPAATKEVIATASRVIGERLAAQGKDPMAELRGNMDGVVQDVVDYIDDIRASLGGSRRNAETGAGRARGTLSGHNRQPTRQAPKEKPYDPQELLHDIQKIQRDHRLY